MSLSVGITEASASAGTTTEGCAECLTEDTFGRSLPLELTVPLAFTSVKLFGFKHDGTITMDPTSSVQMKMCVKHVGQAQECCETLEMTWTDLSPTRTNYKAVKMGELCHIRATAIGICKF